MRLVERTLKELWIAPGLTCVDALGGAGIAFSPERVYVRASVIPQPGELAAHDSGWIDGGRCLALMPLDAPIAPGDGIAEAEDGPVRWRCVDVRRWAAHLAADLRRLNGVEE